MSLLEQVLNPRNTASAQKRVIANKGEAGIDGMKVSELGAYMAENRPFIIESIENGTYQPQAVLTTIC
jgi:retron-type reverse transcriptase